MTVTLARVANFGDLSPDLAKVVLYNELVPACEKKKVYLSQYGNHNGTGSLTSVENYEIEKAKRTLFDVEGVQRAFTFISTHFNPTYKYTLGSYGLKHKVERIQGEYLTNGDLIAAMLMNGFSARFAKRGEPLNVNCQFKLKLFSEKELASQRV